MIETKLNEKDIQYLKQLYINNHIRNSKYKYKINIIINKRINLENYKIMINKVYEDTNDIFLTFKLRKAIFCTNNNINIILYYIILNIIDDEIKGRRLIFNRIKNNITIYVNSYKAKVRVKKNILSFINNLGLVEVLDNE